jgi:hypothetical protein
VEGTPEYKIEFSEAGYGDYNQEPSLHREGTPIQFFDDFLPSLGNATDFQRSIRLSQDAKFFN